MKGDFLQMKIYKDLDINFKNFDKFIYIFPFLGLKDKVTKLQKIKLRQKFYFYLKF